MRISVIQYQYVGKRTWVAFSLLSYYQNSEAKREAVTTVSIPARAMERELMAPSTSPISRAFTVPRAWLEQPIAMPLAMGSLIRNSLQIGSAKILPSIPEMMMEATAMAT